MSEVVVVEADKEGRDLYGGMSAAMADESCLQGKVCVLQTECWAWDSKVSAGLIVVVSMIKCSITLYEQLWKRDR